MANSDEKQEFVLIIGAMKSGTTSLFDLLGQHPEINPAIDKEPNYFIKDRKRSYLDLWKEGDSCSKLALESSVAYTKFPFIEGVPKRINEYSAGNFRFIYIVRHPIKRIESQVRHGIFAGWGQSLDEGMSEDLIAFSSYAMQLEEYRKYFSRDKIFIVVLEEFKQSPEKVLTDICEFLNLDKEFKFKNVKERKNSGDFFNTPKFVSKLTQGNIGKFFIKYILTKNFKNWLRNKMTAIAKLNNEKGNTQRRWQTTAEERDKILRALEADLKQLNKEYAVDVKKFWHLNLNE